MKKQTNLSSIKLRFLAICAAITVTIGATFSVSAQQPGPVLKDRLVKVLREKSLSNEQITSIIKKNGVDFQLSSAVETELRNAGADNTVIEAARNNHRGEALLTGNHAETITANHTTTKYRVGDTIEVEYYGKWYKAEILETKDGSYKIHYIGQTYHFIDEWVKTDRMRSARGTAPANKQTDPQTTNQANNNWKVGDRVEINYYAAVWIKGTIISVIVDDNGRQAGAQVRADDEKDYTGAQRVYRLQIEALRRLNETPAEKQTQHAKQTLADKSVVKLRLDSDNNILADREVLDCNNLGIKPVKNGTRPTLETAGKKIRCPREKKGSAETATIDITSFQVGPPSKWRSYRDVGADATLQTLVYPIKTAFTEKTFTRALVYTRELETIYNCYVNTFGDWRCFHTGIEEKGKTKRTPVQP